MSYGQKAATGLGWMFTSSISVQGIGILSTMVLARLLLPTDFGVVAVVLSIIGILQTFAELGMSVALIQREKLTRSLIDSAFIATVVLTLTIMAVIWFTSAYIAFFFKMSILSDLLKIAVFSYLFTGIFSLYRCLLLRDLRYKTISAIGCGSILIGSTISIILAYRGYGAYSIVWGKMLSEFVSLLAGVWFTKYFPGSLGRLKEMRSLFSFGMWVSLGRLMGQSAGKLDVFVVGKVLDAATLGGYYMAQKIVLLIPGTYASVIDQVMLPIYSKLQKESDRVHDSYFKTLSLTSIVLLPSVCLIFLFADPLVRIFLGDKWLQISPLIMIMSIYGIMRSLGGGVFASVIYSLGRPHLATVANAFRMVALPACVLVGSLWGVLGVAWGFGLYGVIGRIFNQWLLKHFFGFSFLLYLKAIFPASFSVFIATVPSFLICYFLANGNLLNMVLWNLTALIVWSVIYFIIIKMLARQDVDYLWRIVKPLIQKTPIYRGLLRL